MTSNETNTLNNLDKPNVSYKFPREEFNLVKTLKRGSKSYKDYRNKVYLPLLFLLCGLALLVGNMPLLLFTLVPLMRIYIYYNDDGSFAFIDSETSLWNISAVNGEISYSINNMIWIMVPPIIFNCIWLFSIPLTWLFISRNKIKNTFFIDKFDEIYKPISFFKKYTLLDCNNLKKSILMYVQLTINLLIIGCIIYLFFVSFEKPNIDSMQNANKNILSLWSSELKQYSFERNGSTYNVFNYRLKPTTYTILAGVFIIIGFIFNFFPSKIIYINILVVHSLAIIEKLKDKTFFESLSISDEDKLQITQIIKEIDEMSESEIIDEIDDISESKMADEIDDIS